MSCTMPVLTLSHRAIMSKNIGVINLSGRTFMPALDCPFQKVEQILREIEGKCDIILLDFHAEATSEKLAMGWYLDGRIHGLVGTHTHVQTADERILPKGTAYITDLGMVGPWNSILGVGLLVNLRGRQPHRPPTRLWRLLAVGNGVLPYSPLTSGWDPASLTGV